MTGTIAPLDLRRGGVVTGYTHLHIQKKIKICEKKFVEVLEILYICCMKNEVYTDEERPSDSIILGICLFKNHTLKQLKRMLKMSHHDDVDLEGIKKAIELYDIYNMCIPDEYIS